MYSGIHEINKRKANWVDHILCRNCLLWQVIEVQIKGGMKVTGRRGRRRRKLLAGCREGSGYPHLKEEALDRTMWTARFGRGFGPVVRQTAKWMNEFKEKVKLSSANEDTWVRKYNILTHSRWMGIDQLCAPADLPTRKESPVRFPKRLVGSHKRSGKCLAPAGNRTLITQTSNLQPSQHTVHSCNKNQQDVVFTCNLFR
jgi:hypothetical protein